MTSKDSEAQVLRRKNRNVVIALVCGIVGPFLYFGFLDAHLPRWLGVLIVGGIWWICFFEIIPSNTVGIFRKPAKKEPSQPSLAKPCGGCPEELPQRQHRTTLDKG